MMTTKLLTSLNCQLWRSTLPRWNQSMVRNLSTTARFDQQQQEQEKVPIDAAELVMNSKWRTIFKFPFIKQIVSINKVKMYHTAFTLFIVPASMLTELLNTPLVAAIGGTGIITLSLVSFALNRFVGFVYISEEHPKLIRFAYINIWGKRIDEIFEISKVKLIENVRVPIVSDMFSFVEFDGEKKKLKLSHNFGGIIDREKFYEIFGKEF